MFGKHFASLYEGSMIGAGAIVFAVWGYVIAKHMPDREYGSTVTLNPNLLGPILGESPEDVKEAIEFLCAPDKGTTTPTADGRRLIKIAAYEYQVVNGAKYRAIRDEETRKQQNREAQARYREKLKSESNSEAPAKPKKKKTDKEKYEQIKNFPRVSAPDGGGYGDDPEPIEYEEKEENPPPVPRGYEEGGEI